MQCNSTPPVSNAINLYCDVSKSEGPGRRRPEIGGGNPELPQVASGCLTGCLLPEGLPVSKDPN